MARIAGVDLPRDKRIEIGLTYIYGIGLVTSKDILAKAGVDGDIRVRDLTEEDAGKIRKVIETEHIVEGDLRREVSLNIKRETSLLRSPSTICLVSMTFLIFPAEVRESRHLLLHRALRRLQQRQLWSMVSRRWRYT